MKRRLTNLILAAIPCILIPLLWTAPCFAGAWTQAQGKSYHQFTVNYYYADQSFDDDGDRRDFAADGDFMDLNVNYYMEYGLTDRLTAISSFYYKYLKFEDNAVESKTYGVPDIDLGLRCKLSDTAAGIFSVQTQVKIPDTYDDDDTVPLGNGQYDLESRLLYGKSLYPKIPGYINLEAGYRWRLEAPADEFRYLVEFGLDFSSTAYGRIKLDGIYSMGNSDNEAGGNNPKVTNEFDLGKLDLAIGRKLSNDWAVELGVRPEIYGQNTSSGTNVSLAVTFKR